MTNFIKYMLAIDAENLGFTVGVLACYFQPDSDMVVIIQLMSQIVKNKNYFPVDLILDCRISSYRILTNFKSKFNGSV